MDKEIIVYTRNGLLSSHKKRMKSCHFQQHGWTTGAVLSKIRERQIKTKQKKSTNQAHRNQIGGFERKGVREMGALFTSFLV